MVSVMHSALARRPRSASSRRFDRDQSERVLRINDLLELVVDSLSQTFALSEAEAALAYLVLLGRNPYAIARTLELDERQVIVEISALFCRTQTDSRETLFHLGLRLSNAWINRAPTSPPPASPVSVSPPAAGRVGRASALHDPARL